MRFPVAAAVIVLLGMSPALAGPDRVSIMVGSRHVGGHGFEEQNPGVFLTWENPRVHWSAGIYRNSYAKPSVAVTAAVPIVRWEDGELSAFAGAALYPQDGMRFPVHAGDVVPIGGIQIRHHHVFVQVSPSDGKATDAVLAFGLTFPMR